MIYEFGIITLPFWKLTPASYNTLCGSVAHCADGCFSHAWRKKIIWLYNQCDRNETGFWVDNFVKLLCLSVSKLHQSYLMKCFPSKLCPLAQLFYNFSSNYWRFIVCRSFFFFGLKWADFLLKLFDKCMKFKENYYMWLHFNHKFLEVIPWPFSLTLKFLK